MKRKLTIMFLPFLFLLVLQGSLPSVHGITRQIQSVNSPVTFFWSSNIQLPRGQLSSTLNFPIGIAASGLPDKIIPGEIFQIPISMSLTTGIGLVIGGQAIDLDSILSPVLPYVPSEVDLRPYIALITCTISRFVLDPIDFVFACGLDGSGLTSGVVHQVLRYIEVKLVNYLTITIQAGEPADLIDPLLQTWFGKSGTFKVAVSALAQRGQQLVLTFASEWTASLYFNFQQSLYDDPVVGWVFKKIRDALNLPWQPSFGIAQGSSTPSMTSIVLIPDFRVATSQPTVALTQGQSTSVEITVESIDEFDEQVSLMAQAPPGVQVQFDSFQVSPRSAATLSILASDSATVGDYEVTVSASGGGKLHDLSLPIRISRRDSNPTISTSGAELEAGPESGRGTAIPLIPLAVVAIVLPVTIIALVAAAKSQRVNWHAPSAKRLHVRWFCRYCGTQIRFGATYCGTCGRNLK